MYLKRKKRKNYLSPHYIPQKRKTLSLTKISYVNFPPYVYDYFHPKTTSPFCHEWQRESNSSGQLIVTGGASILILIIIRVTIVVLVLRSLWKRRGRLYKATKASLPSSNTGDTSVHLTQLITESVKASIHALKLCHDRIKSHSTRKRRRSGYGWRRRSRRSCHLSLCLPRTKLGITLSNGSNVNGTHHKEVIRRRIGDGKGKNDSRDDWWKNELIVGHRIPIDIYKG